MKHSVLLKFICNSVWHLQPMLSVFGCVEGVKLS